MQQLRKLESINGYRLRARDGEIGKLKEIYFDDRHWSIRYFVVHTGSWLLGRDVLIVPSVITGVDESDRRLEVDLDLEQIRGGPPVEKAMPVSLHYEQEYYRYYGWEPYWTGDPLFAPGPAMPPATVSEPHHEPPHPHLRSSDEVTGYRIHARDGEIGRVEDFILEEVDWKIAYLELDTRKWLPGKNVLLAPGWIEQVSWTAKEVTVDLSVESIKTAPAYDASEPIRRDYELALYRHYGMSFDRE